MTVGKIARQAFLSRIERTNKPLYDRIKFAKALNRNPKHIDAVPKKVLEAERTQVLLTKLIMHEAVETTLGRAKLLKKEAEQVISMAKQYAETGRSNEALKTKIMSRTMPMRAAETFEWGKRHQWRLSDDVKEREEMIQNPEIDLEHRLAEMGLQDLDEAYSIPMREVKVVVDEVKHQFKEMLEEIQVPEAFDKLSNVLVQRYAMRSDPCVRLLKAPARDGDRIHMAVVELVDGPFEYWTAYLARVCGMEAVKNGGKNLTPYGSTPLTIRKVWKALRYKTEAQKNEFQAMVNDYRREVLEERMDRRLTIEDLPPDGPGQRREYVKTLLEPGRREVADKRSTMVMVKGNTSWASKGPSAFIKDRRAQEIIARIA